MCIGQWKKKTIIPHHLYFVKLRTMSIFQAFITLRLNNRSDNSSSLHSMILYIIPSHAVGVTRFLCFPYMLRQGPVIDTYRKYGS